MYRLDKERRKFCQEAKVGLFSLFAIAIDMHVLMKIFQHIWIF
jgi:hypothetical protein